MFIKVTLFPDRGDFYINVSNIIHFKKDESEEYSVITMPDTNGGATWQCVKETPEEILELIKEAKLKNGELQAQAIYDMFYSVLIQKL